LHRVLKYDPKNEEVRNSLRRIAEDLVKKEIILKNYIEQEGLEATEEEIAKTIEEKAKIYRMDPQVIQERIGKAGANGRCNR